MSRQELADAVNAYLAGTNDPDGPVTANHVGKLEQGTNTWPRALRRQAYRTVLGATTDAELGFYNIRRRPTDTPAPLSAEVSSTTSAIRSTVARSPDGSTVEGAEPSLTAQPVAEESTYRRLAEDLIEWAMRMKRRDVLQWLSSSAASAATSAFLAGLDTHERTRVVKAVTSPRRVDHAVVDHIDAVLWRCMRQDDILGPQSALDTVLAQQNLVRSLLPDSSGHVRARLLSVYANLSRFAGWLCFDLNNQAAARDHYEIARVAAHEAEDGGLAAFILCNMSHLAGWYRQPRVGIDHAIAAQGWARQTDDQQLQAYTFDVAARALAMDGQRGAAMRSLDQAEHALDAAKQASPWVYFYGHDHLLSTRGQCLLHLGDARLAVTAAEQAIAATDATFVRNIAFTKLELGSARIRLKNVDLDGAVQAFSNSADLANQNRSPRLVESLRQAAERLDRWATEPRVRRLRDRLAGYRLA